MIWKLLMFIFAATASPADAALVAVTATALAGGTASAADATVASRAGLVARLGYTYGLASHPNFRSA